MADGGLVLAGRGGRALHGCASRLSPKIAVEFNESEPRKILNSEKCSSEVEMQFCKVLREGGGFVVPGLPPSPFPAGSRVTDLQWVSGGLVLTTPLDPRVALKLGQKKSRPNPPPSWIHNRCVPLPPVRWETVVVLVRCRAGRWAWGRRLPKVRYKG